MRDLYLRLADIPCLITDFYNTEQTFFILSTWKLDPWCVDSLTEEERAHCITITRSLFTEEEMQSFEELPLLYRRRNETAIYRVYSLCPDGSRERWTMRNEWSRQLMLVYDLDRTENRITLRLDRTRSNGEMAQAFLVHMLEGLYLPRQYLGIHGVLLEYQGQGIILSAPSGTGKTTHARLWREHKNALIVNGDRPVLHKADGVWQGYGFPWSGSSGEQINRNVPMKALVVLHRGEENRVRRLSGAEALGELMPHLRRPLWRRDLQEQALDLALDCMESVPVYRLECRPDFDAVDTLAAALKLE